MYEWENRLTSVDNNRVVRPLEWGVEWAHEWPCRNGIPAGQMPADAEKFFADYNQRIIADSDEFFSYRVPTDFRLERREIEVFSTREVPDPKLEGKVRGTYSQFLRFTSPVHTPYPDNNLVNARWFPARGRRAIVCRAHRATAWHIAAKRRHVCRDAGTGEGWREKDRRAQEGRTAKAGGTGPWPSSTGQDDQARAAGAAG